MSLHFRGEHVLPVQLHSCPDSCSFHLSRLLEFNLEAADDFISAYRCTFFLRFAFTLLLSERVVTLFNCGFMWFMYFFIELIYEQREMGDVSWCFILMLESLFCF